MKIKTIFQINLALFLILAAATIVNKQPVLPFLFVPITFSLAALLTQWWIPLTCGRISSHCLKIDRPRWAEMSARFGMLVGQALDSQYSKFTNLPRHLTPTFNCSSHLRVALLTQGKFAEMQKIENQQLLINKDEGGTVEGSGRSKAKIASTMHKIGDCTQALILINEALNELSQTRISDGFDGDGSVEYVKSRNKIVAAETLTALFTRASILESIQCYDDALRDRVKAFKLAQETFGAATKETAPHMVMLGKVYLKKKEFDKALPLFTEALEIRLKAFKSNDKLVSSAQLALAEYYCELDDLTSAATYLKPAFEAAIKREKTSPGPFTADYYKVQAIYCEKLKRSADAGKYYALARKNYLKYFPANNPTLYELNLKMIDFFRQNGQSAQTAPLELDNSKIEATFAEAKQHISR